MLYGAAVALAACGGGGGSNGSADGIPADGADGVSQGGGQQPPSTLAPLALNDVNAVDAAFVAVGAMEQAAQAAEMAVFLVDLRGLSGGGGGSATALCGGLDGSGIDILDRDGNGRLSSGDAIKAGYFTCRESTGMVTVELTRYGPGVATFDAEVEFAAEYKQETNVEGSFKLVSTHGLPREEGRDQTLSEITLSYTAADVSAQVSDGRLERELRSAQNLTPFELVYRFTLSGKVVSDSLGGEYTFETPTPLAGTLRDSPSSGELALNSVPTRARFVSGAESPYGNQVVDLEIDLDGSGQFELAASVPWARLTTGLLFSSEANTRPIITKLAVNPPGATGEDDLAAEYAAEDPDGDELSYGLFWIRNGNLLQTNAATLASINFSKGDLIELRLTVYDGQAFVERTVEVAIANSPPRDVAVSITPAIPKSVDSLTLAWNATDPDGDALNAVFEWHVNGNVVAGQTTSVLLPSAFRKGDVVTGIVHVSDGADSASAGATVTILDTPAMVAISSAPSSIHHGETVTFDAIASDPDGDDVSRLRYVLVYGPAGMSVDPESGAVSWVASGPMFEQTMDVHFGVTVDEPGASVATGTLAVTDLDREFPFMRMGFDQSPPGDLVTGDFDADGADEVLVLVSLKSVFELDAEPSGTGYRQSWSYLLGFGDSEPIRAATAGDVDGDGRHEIFLASRSAIVRLDGVHRRKLRAGEPGVETPFTCWGLEFGDINRDGAAELVCAESSRLAVLDALTLQVLAEMPGPSAPIVLGNVDSDAALEIVTANGYVLDGSDVLAQNGRVQWLFPDGFGARLSTGDIDGDGIDEIVAGDNLQPARVFDALARTLRGTLGNFETRSVHVADIDEDGIGEILVGSGSDVIGPVEIQVYRQDPGGTAMSLVLSVDAMSPQGVSAITAGDFDGDGAPEIVWGSSTSGLVLASYNSGLDIEWRPNEGSAPPTVYAPFIGGDVMGDPFNERAPLFLGMHSSLPFGADAHLISIDPESGNLRYSSGLGELHVLAITDYDGDRYEEVFVAGPGRVEMYDEFSSGNVVWSREIEAPAAIAHGDLNGDSYQDLLVLDWSGVVRAYDVFHDSLLWESDATGSGGELAAADLDGDGVLEIIVAADLHVFVYSRNTASTYERTASAEFPDFLDMVIGDADGDDIAEVYVATFAESRFTTRVWRLDKRLQPRGSFDLDWLINGVAIEESPYGKKNLVVLGSGRLVVVDAGSGAEVWRAPPLLGQQSGVRFVDIEGDGDLRMTVTTDLGILLTR